jgi:NAD+ kinase
MKISIFYKESELSNKICDKIISIANEHNIKFSDVDPDVVFYVGGDGTFLRAIQKYRSKLNKIIFVGIHSGHLGFFYDYGYEEIEEAFESILHKNYDLKKYPLLKAELTYDNDATKLIYAVNEIRIENPFHTLVSDVLIDNVRFETFHGNGLLVSSPLGSSAYNKSIGGALMCSDLDALQITEIAPIQNKSSRSIGSSLILSGDKKVEFVGDLNNVVVGYDHLSNDISNVKKVEISLTERNIKIAHKHGYAHLARIRESFTE